MNAGFFFWLFRVYLLYKYVYLPFIFILYLYLLSCQLQNLKICCCHVTLFVFFSRYLCHWFYFLFINLLDESENDTVILIRQCRNIKKIVNKIDVMLIYKKKKIMSMLAVHYYKHKIVFQLICLYWVHPSKKLQINLKVPWKVQLSFDIIILWNPLSN